MNLSKSRPTWCQSPQLFHVEQLCGSSPIEGRSSHSAIVLNEWRDEGQTELRHPATLRWIL